MNTTKIELHKIKRPTKRKPTRQVWQLRWYGSEINPKTGQPKRYCDTIGEAGAMTQREARAILRERQGDMDHSESPRDKPTRMTLSVFRTEYDEMIRSKVAVRTRENVTQAFTWAENVIGGDTLIQRITTAHADRITNRMKDAGRSDATVNKVLSYLRAAFNRAKKRGMLFDNPFAGIEMPTVDGKESRIFDRDEIDSIVSAAPDQWWRAFLSLGFTSGLRRNEILTLTWSHIDLESGTVSVYRCDGGEFTVKGEAYPMLPWTAKAKASYRTIPIPPQTAAELRLLRSSSDGSIYAFLSLDRLHAIQERQASGQWQPSDHLVNNLHRDFRAIERAALGEDAKLGSVHDMRKSYGTLTAQAVPMHVLKDLMGHARIETTAKFYTKVRDTDADTVRDFWKSDAQPLKLAGAA